MTRSPAVRRPCRPLARQLSVLSVAGLGLLAGCGSSLLGSTSSTIASSTATTGADTPSTTVPVNGEVAVAFPVVACVDPSYGGSAIKASSGWHPSIMVAPVPTSLVGKVTFYSDGVHTLLAPSGWTCALVAPAPTGSGSIPGACTRRSEKCESEMPASE